MAGEPLDAGDGAKLAMLDMQRCALFVYVGLDGKAVAQFAPGVPKSWAAAALRQIAAEWDRS
jgi:hypothetical protein